MSLGDDEASSDDEEGWELRKKASRAGKGVISRSRSGPVGLSDDLDAMTMSSKEPREKLRIGERFDDDDDDDDAEILRGFVPPRISSNPPLPAGSSQSNSQSKHTQIDVGKSSSTTTTLSGKTGLQGIKDLSSLRSSVIIKPGQRIRVRPGGRKALASLASSTGDNGSVASSK